MSMKTESTPPPKIGKIGPYTVFITPPPTPTSNNHQTPKPVHSPKMLIPSSEPTRPPPVQAPPMQIPKHTSNYSSSSSHFGFFWDTITKLQNAHASLDEKMAYWFGLDESKYQWALDDYYESNGIGVGINQKDIDSKVANKV